MWSGFSFDKSKAIRSRHFTDEKRLMVLCVVEVKGHNGLGSFLFWHPSLGSKIKAVAAIVFPTVKDNYRTMKSCVLSSGSWQIVFKILFIITVS